MVTSYRGSKSSIRAFGRIMFSISAIILGAAALIAGLNLSDESKESDASDVSDVSSVSSHESDEEVSDEFARRPFQTLTQQSFEESADAIVIAVLGVTGSGKSTFIKTVTGRKDVIVGNKLTSGIYLSYLR